ncbi:MAG: hypothetical protein R3302_02110 [Sulfurimonadaceae bacterium]|nr:hypothetical protein [Sulfurimonadaceae bacterium]
MKVAVQCESPLLQRSLEAFLASHLSTYRQCDVVVRDRQIPDDTTPALIISNEIDGALPKPFTRSQLMLALEQMADNNEQVKEAVALSDELSSLTEEEPAVTAADSVSGEKDFSILEKRIEQLTLEYQQNVMKAVRAFYEE